MGQERARGEVPEWRRTASPVNDKRGSDALRESVEAKWIATNRLAELEAKRRIEILTSTDVKDEVRRYHTRIRRQTEANMVGIEKTHAFLRSTGNVPGEIPVQISEVDAEGRVQTVLSGQTISPDSSASQHEFRQMLKEKTDLEAKYSQLIDAIEGLGLSVDKLGVAKDKELWTVDGDGIPTVANEKILALLSPEGYAIGEEVALCDDGERRVPIMLY